MKRPLQVFIIIFKFVIIAYTQFLFSQNDDEAIYLSRIEQGMKYYREQAFQYQVTDPNSATALASLT